MCDLFLAVCFLVFVGLLVGWIVCLLVSYLVGLVACRRVVRGLLLVVCCLLLVVCGLCCVVCDLRFAV